MAEQWDVAGRLAEGRDAVGHTEAYVKACQAIGGRSLDVGAVYDAESGLDLTVLDADCGALRAAADAVQEALDVQRAQLTELATSWRGAGADSAARFLQRHCDTAEQLANRVRSAAQGCAALRDDLWRSVDSRVATTTEIDDRRAAERSTWLAAAHTVTAGAGDRSAAEELVEQHVIPYVDNDIRHDWMSAMQSSAASVARSYDSAIHALTSAPDLRFEIPGDLGPSWQPAADEPMRPIPDVPVPAFSTPVDPLPTVPAAAAPLPSSSPMPEPQPLDDAPAQQDAPLGDMSGLSTGAGGLGGVAGGIGGVLGSIVDGIESLIGSLTGGLGESGGQALDDSADDAVEPVADEVVDEGDDDKKQAEPVSADDTVVPEQPAAPITDSPPATDDAVAGPAAPRPVDPPPTQQAPPASPASLPDGSTPCEIAEDQLPQAGQ